MRRVVPIIVATGLLLIPFAGLGQIQQAVPPPVAQTLVREGEFARKLADRLKMGSSGSEAEAESALASASIAPRNGWIADYPITPDIAGELQEAITQAADSGRLGLNKDEALMAFQDLCAEVGLSVVADTRGEIVQNDPPTDYGQYSNPDVINNYYYNEGPPVVTYYPPPWDYDYMYAWVPYPFWYSGFWFSGFFILNDFHRPIYGHGGPWFVSNHYRDYESHRVYTVDPVTRHNGRDFRREGDLSHGRGFRSTEARNGAASIYGRNYERSGHGNAPNGANSTRPGSRLQAGYSANRGNSSPVSNNRTSGSERPSATRGNRNEAGPRSSGERPSSQQRSFEGSSRAPSVSGNRSFRPPSGGVSRPSASPSLGSRSSSANSFRTPSMGGNRSFTAPSTGSRGSYRGSSRAPSVSGNRSFRPPSGGVSRPSASPSFGSRSSSASSFRAPSMGGNRSFTAPSTGSRGSYRGSSRGF
jgi:hypothetical protein